MQPAQQRDQALPALRWPFARLTGVWSDDNSDTLVHQMMDRHGQPQAGSRRGHADEWYELRCVFCAACKTSINSQFDKRGQRCQGCRRWFHAGCDPASAAGDTGSTQQPAGDAQARPDGSSSGHSRQHFFHDAPCREVYQQLAAVASAGTQAFSVPATRPFWQFWRSGRQPELDTWRLLDLSDVKALYRDAQKRGTLFRQAAAVQQQLEQSLAAAAAPPPRGNGAAAQQQGADAAAARRVAPTRLDDFLVAAELLKPLGETPRELLEDSFALISRDASGAPLSVATFNLYGQDHARLQGLLTPQGLRRQGHAGRLLRQMEAVLAGAGLAQLAAILEPKEEGDAASAERWLARRGFREADAEQRLQWRRELPEYHKSLIAGCQLLVKPLAAPGARGW